jgi:hypothetical protein
MQAGAFGGSTAQQTDRTVDEERIPLVEEEAQGRQARSLLAAARASAPT